MLRRRLGARGPDLSVVGLGTWAAGGPYRFGWGPQDDRDSIAAIRRAVEGGVNWIDTAPAYGLGHAEAVVGRAIEPFRPGEDVLLFTKCGRTWTPDEPDQLHFDLRPATIREECEASLRRLEVDRLDLLQFHWPDLETGTPIEESWAAMGELIREGKVRWAGVSNFDVDLLERCEAVRHVDSLQPPLNMIQRDALDDLIPWCRAHGTGVIAYGPMAHGLLAGRTDRGRVEALAPDDWRRNSPLFNEPHLSRNLALAERLLAIADERKIDLPLLTLGWVLAQPGVTCAAVGARTPAQVEGWRAAGNAELEAETLEAIARAIEESGARADPPRPTVPGS